MYFLALGQKETVFFKRAKCAAQTRQSHTVAITGQELTERMWTFLFLWVFKRYMPACTHLCFWEFLSQSSNSVSWNLGTVLKLISQLSLHVLIHPAPQHRIFSKCANWIPLGYTVLEDNAWENLQYAPGNSSGQFRVVLPPEETILNSRATHPLRESNLSTSCFTLHIPAQLGHLTAYREFST